MSSPSPVLRPMGLGDILDQAVRLYRQNFVTLVAICAAVSVPVLLVQVLTDIFALPSGGNLAQPSSLSTSGAFGLVPLIGQAVTVILAGVGAAFQSGALAIFISERYLGRTLTFRQAYGRAFKRWGTLLLAEILFGLGAVLPLVLPFILFTASVLVARNETTTTLGATVLVASLCLCVLFVPAFLLYIFLGVRWEFFVQAIVIENYNSTGGLGRSWKLVRGAFWRTLAFFLILGFVVLAFTLGPTLLVTVGSRGILPMFLSTIFGAVARTLLVTLMAPIQYAAVTLYYYDLRIRKEGLDLQIKLDPSEPQNPPAPDLPSLLPRATA